ncbi:hypothetical protein SH203_02869 [Brevundimonas sp. SH203]|uniref:hypothetical protein n=1 Tax=Brevundimonas sp. SH203 TaxID=345167 RepID=UPI0009D00267|nr:hypothetical protein [Brevundimonas sp. SH203]GAW42453.1 hypothetical protein SH203_02869 [Brevundimonas sp. SH203]
MKTPAAPSNLRNGLKWRDGRPYWEPSPANRACGFKGMVLKTAAGEWMERGAATTAADARTLWAKIVREAMQDTDAGGAARIKLRAALDRLPTFAADPHARSLVADLIERGRAVLEDREPGLTAATSRGDRTVDAMIEGFFNDAEALNRIARSSQRQYRIQSRKLSARFGRDRVDALTRPQLRAWYLELQKSVSTTTANAAIGVAGALFRWAMWQDPAWIDASPCTNLGLDQAEGRLVFWTFEEEQPFTAWCDANGYSDVADCVVTGLWTAASPVDICAATVGDLSKSVWRYMRAKTKRKKQEAVPGITDPVRQRVARRRAELAKSLVLNPDAMLFLWNHGLNRPHTSTSIRDRFTEARAAAIASGAVPATLADKKLQDMRDTCVTRLFASDPNIDRIMPWTGHSRKSGERILRQHYLSLLDEGAIESAERLSGYAERSGFKVAV